MTTILAVGTGSLQTWIRDNVIPLLLLVIATVLLIAAQRGDNARAVRIVGGVLVALAVLGLSTGGNAESVGAFLWKLVTGA
jgi:membrane-bound ClpP family serine protease